MNKTILNILSALSLLFLLGSILLNVFVLKSDTGVMAKIAAGASVCALICGIVYFAKGGKKNAAGFFRAYVILYGISELLTVSAVLTALDDGYIPSVMLTVLCFGILSILAEAKDLGKTRSCIFSGIITLARLVWFILILILFPYGLAAVAASAASFALAYTLQVMILAKYADKEDRGRSF